MRSPQEYVLAPRFLAPPSGSPVEPSPALGRGIRAHTRERLGPSVFQFSWNERVDHPDARRRLRLGPDHPGSPLSASKITKSHLRPRPPAPGATKLGWIDRPRPPLSICTPPRDSRSFAKRPGKKRGAASGESALGRAGEENKRLRRPRPDHWCSRLQHSHYLLLLLTRR